MKLYLMLILYCKSINDTNNKHITGAVTLVKNVVHPISLARLVMEETPHAFLGGPAVNEFATKSGMPTVPNCHLITSAARAALEVFKYNQWEPIKAKIRWG